MERMPGLGQGTWRMGERSERRDAELLALRTGLDAGMQLIDTAEMYGEGGAERVVGEALRGVDRDTVYLVSKVYPHNAGRERIMRSCEGSLRRLGVEVLDLYLLHWRGGVPLVETVEGMEALVRAGKIRRWGVSNFDVEDMKELAEVPGGNGCAANQVLYHLGSRGIEYSLRPWMEARGMPVMAYCPLAQAGRLREGLTGNAAVRKVAGRRGITPMQVLLGFVMAQPGTVAIPKAADVAHVRQNAAMLGIALDAEDLRLLETAYPAPTRKLPLDIE